MRAAFADTSFYVALFSHEDERHGAAVVRAGASELRVVTTEFVLLETSNFFTRPSLRSRFVELMARVASSRRTRIVPATHALYVEGLALFAKRPDKEWSLTDCTSFVVMRRLGLREALTGDRHFRQAGFVPLLA